jgi:hypothetical protein
VRPFTGRTSSLPHYEEACGRGWRMRGVGRPALVPAKVT